MATLSSVVVVYHRSVAYAIKRTVAVLATGGLTACSLVVDTGGLSSLPSGAPYLDSSTSTDHGGSDGDSRSDTSLGGGFCNSLAPKPTFCDDFDDAALRPGWVKTEQSGKLAYDTTVVRSSPNALLITPDVSTAAYTEVYLDHADDHLAAKIQLAFDVRFGGAFPSDAVSVCSLLFTAQPGGGSAIVLTADSSGANVVLSENNRGTYTSHSSTKAFALNVWIHVDVEVDLDVHHVTMTFDGAVVVDSKLQPAWTPGFTTLRIGNEALGNNPQPAFAIRFDNVVLDVK